MSAESGLRRFYGISIAFLAHALTMLGEGVQLPGGLNERVARIQIREFALRLEAIEEVCDG